MAVVETSYGTLAGAEEQGIHVFRGVPFATPPVGHRRFRPPLAPVEWAGVRDATRFGPQALQNPNAFGMLGFDQGPMDEDCLLLNVWTPGPAGRRPVLVWIHGGAFVIGAGSQALYDGATLARRGDVVVVTINYRLGAFGYLHLGREPAAGGTGNEGLLDQIAALAWVRDEIAAFGGDPANVTIFGESAGAMSVATLLGTPAARGLFHKAIMQSGSANFVRSRERAAQVTGDLLAELGLALDDHEPLVGAPPARLLEVQQQVFARGGATPALLPFAPVVDGTVLPRHPFDAIAGGLNPDVPVLIGTTLDEMKLFSVMDSQVRRMDEGLLLGRLEKRLPGRAAEAIRIYRDARAARGLPTTPAELWCAIESDRVFRIASMRLATLQRGHTPHTYTYLFTWRSPLLGGTLGACHALELPFVFGTLTQKSIGAFAGRGADAEALAERMQDAWLAFARHGNPSTRALGAWPAYEPGRRATMVLDRECRVEDAPLEVERRFWE